MLWFTYCYLVLVLDECLSITCCLYFGLITWFVFDVTCWCTGVCIVLFALMLSALIYVLLLCV